MVQLILLQVFCSLCLFLPPQFVTVSTQLTYSLFTFFFKPNFEKCERCAQSVMHRSILAPFQKCKHTQQRTCAVSFNFESLLPPASSLLPFATPLHPCLIFLH